MKANPFDAKPRLAEPDAPAMSVGVQRITVKGLFGQFDYELKSDTADLSDLFILYGDNGSGKTTILRILFHLLSPGRSSGHKSAIKEIPFERFEVRLVDQTCIVLSRQNAIIGPYLITIQQPGMKPLTLSFGSVEERQNRFATPADDEAFFAFLEPLQLTVYLLSADRRIESDIFRSDDEDDSGQLALWRAGTSAVPPLRVQFSSKPSSQQDEQIQSVVRAMQLASAWIRGQVLQAANKGTSSSHNIYADIVKHIVATQLHEQAQTEKNEEVVRALRALADKSTGYARFGFVPMLAVDEMINAISKGNTETIRTIQTILTPYIQGTDARLQELQSIYTLTKRFIDDLNGFYSLKTVDFNLRRGLSIRLPNGHALSPELLSSGEKHLLLLLCHVLMSNDRRCIFIIDEPELSLNIKWQRKLVKTLLHIIGNSNVQFILATHAIELLSEHDDNVVELIPIPSSTRSGDDTQAKPHEPIDNS